MKSPFSIFIRLILLGVVALIAYVYIARPQNLPTPIQSVVQLSLSKTDSLLSRANQSGILDKAGDRLTKPQPIIETSSINQSGDVMGSSTSQIGEEAKKMLDSTVNQVAAELQSLPKKEAAKILRQTCEQIASELEK